MLFFIKGDATFPKISGNKIIAHICNDIGAWGKGFVLAISKRWANPEKQYKIWLNEFDFVLGNIQIVQVEKDIFVANMIAQHNIKTVNNIPPIRYNALDICLRKLNIITNELNASIHMPRIGCGLAGGNWENIEFLLNKNIVLNNIFIYDL